MGAVLSAIQLKQATGAVSTSLKGAQLAEPRPAQRRRGLELCAGPHLRAADRPALAGVLPRADALGARARRAHQPHAGAARRPMKSHSGQPVQPTDIRNTHLS